MSPAPDFLGMELDLFVTRGWGMALLVGLGRSLLIAGGAFGLGLAVGTTGAIGKLYGNRFVRESLELYTTLVRSLPELILILLVYFAGTDLLNRMLAGFGYGTVDINGAVAGIFVLGFVQGAYTTEVIRGAILAIPSGQIEAARAFGMPQLLMLRRIMLPAMIPAAIPGLSNLWLIAMKDTALLAVLGFGELTQVTRQAAGGTKAYFSFFIAAGCLYLLVTLVSTFLTQRLERRLRRGLA